MKSVVLWAGILGAVSLGVGCGDSGGGAEGSVGKPCYANATCDAGLDCRSDVCVDLNEGGSGGGKVDELYDWGACFDCGDLACEAEAAECDADCRTALECMLACDQANVTCQQACAPGTFSPEESLGLANYFICTTSACLDECVNIDVGGGTGGANSGSGGANPGTGGADQGTGGVDQGTGGVVQGTGGGPIGDCSAGQDRGSCYGTTFEVCDGGSWVAGDCAACSIVAPAQACGNFNLFAILDYGTYAALPSVPGALTQTSTEVIGEFDFTAANQRGVISLHLPPGAAAYGITGVQATSDIPGVSLDVYLEFGGGASGCQVTLGGSRTIEPCWGDAYDDGLDEFTVINIAAHSSGAGSGTVTVTGISFEF